MQRVLRYPLLLERLLKATPRDHPDYEPLTVACQAARSVAETINKGIARIESQRKTVELASRFDPPLRQLVQPDRYLVKEGSVDVVMSAQDHVYVLLHACVHRSCDTLFRVSR